MIVLDENLHDQRILAAIAEWYPGQVVSIVSLRPRSLIKDDAIPALLRKASQPTFVTINTDDFWKKIQPDNRYCVVNVAVPKEQVKNIPSLLYRLLHHSDFKTKAGRMGKVVRITTKQVEYYTSSTRVLILALPK
jgi:hypothetical protein